MKTITFYLTIITFLLLAFSACKKDDTLPEILEQGQSGGLSEQDRSLGTKGKFVSITVIF